MAALLRNTDGTPQARAAGAARVRDRSVERLQAAVQLAVDSTDVAIASIRLNDGARYIARSLLISAAASVDDQLDEKFADIVRAAAELVHVEDTLEDPRFSAHPAVVGGPRIRGYVGAPIRSRDGRVVGVLAQYWTRPVPVHANVDTTVGIFAIWAGKEYDATTAEDAAERVQQALRPRDLPRFADYEFAGECVTAQQIGGDFLDFRSTADGVAITLGDVMGKGVAAGMLAASIRAVLRGAGGQADPRDDLRIADRVLARDFRAAQSFATLFHGTLRIDDGRVRFVDAGHALTLIVAPDGSTTRLESDNLPLGLLGPQDWRESEAVLPPGGTLVSVSDGVLDLFDGTISSLAAVADIARTARSAGEVVDRLTTLARSEAIPDDVTVIAIRRANR